MKCVTKLPNVEMVPLMEAMVTTLTFRIKTSGKHGAELLCTGHLELSGEERVKITALELVSLTSLLLLLRSLFCCVYKTCDS